MDPDRTAVTMRKFTKKDLENLNFSAYLASSSSEDEGDDQQNDGKQSYTRFIII